METKLKDPHLKLGQVWVRVRKWNGVEYTVFFKLKEKNSNNMWRLELLFANPELPEDYPKEEWWSKERILDYMKLVAKSANVQTLKVLFAKSTV